MERLKCWLRPIVLMHMAFDVMNAFIIPFHRYHLMMWKLRTSLQYNCIVVRSASPIGIGVGCKKVKTTRMWYDQRKTLSVQIFLLNCLVRLKVCFCLTTNSTLLSTDYTFNARRMKKSHDFLLFISHQNRLFVLLNSPSLPSIKRLGWK